MDPASDYDKRSLEAFASLQLTPREAEVLLWISRGKSNRDIAVILGAKTGTICKHVEHIFGKLNVENRTAAAVVALETCPSIAPAPVKKAGVAWAAIASLFTAQLPDLCSNTWEICGEATRLMA